MNTRFCLLILAVLCIATPLRAVPVSPHSPVTITRGATAGDYIMSWKTLPGYSYFIQTSLDPTTGVWSYLPCIRFGTGGDLACGFNSTEPRTFFRLRYTDIPVLGGNPDTADFDGDGLSNGIEIYEQAGDPFIVDTDNDGQNDAQERAAGTDPIRPDTDRDGISDGAEASAGSNPLSFDMPAIGVEFAWRRAEIIQHNLACPQEHTKLYRFLSSTAPPTPATKTLPPFEHSTGGQTTTLDPHSAVYNAWQAAGGYTADPAFTTNIRAWPGWIVFDPIVHKVPEGLLRRDFFGTQQSLQEIQAVVTDTSLTAGTISHNHTVYYGTDTDVRLHSSRPVPINVTRHFLKIDRERAGDPAVPTSLVWNDKPNPEPKDFEMTLGESYSKNLTLTWSEDNRILSHPQTLSVGPTQPIFTTKQAERRLVLLDLDIHEVISDQIAGNTANKLPTRYFKGEPNNPMLLATRTGRTAKLRVRLGSIEPRLYAAVRKVNTTTLLAQASAASSPLLDLSFTVPTATSHDLYEAVCGYDANNNGALENSEVLTVFEKTPRKDAMGLDATVNLDLLDKFIIVDLGQFDQSRSTAYDYGDPLFLGGLFTGYAGDLIHAFADGSNTVADATRTDTIPISSTQPGISHPLGARWNNAANQDTTYRFTFADGTPAADNIESSLALRKLVIDTIKARKAEMLAYSGPEEWPVTPYYSFSGTDNFIDSEATNSYLTVRRLGVAFGKVPIAGQLRVSYKKTGVNAIQVAGVQISGSIDDLYDWAYAGFSLKFYIYNFYAKEPAMTQAGHATLAHGIYPNAGKIFFTRVNFDTNGFKDTWNGNF